MADSQLTKTVFRGEDLTGREFGKWTVIMFACYGPHKHPRWLCRCDCGNERLIYGDNLKRGNTLACRTCSCVLHGMTDTPEFHSWQGMKDRCYNHRSKDYLRYGARGIVVCDRWRNSFAAFISDLGRKPFPKASIDRINNDGPYAPENCRWATDHEQNRNRRDNHFLEFSGRTQCLTDWANEYGISKVLLTSRLRRGWSVERAITEPAGKCGRFSVP